MGTFSSFVVFYWLEFFSPNPVIFFVLSTCIPTFVLPVVPDVVLGNEQPGGHLGVDRGHHQQEYEEEPHLGGGKG